MNPTEQGLTAICPLRDLVATLLEAQFQGVCIGDRCAWWCVVRREYAVGARLNLHWGCALTKEMSA